MKNLDRNTAQVFLGHMLDDENLAEAEIARALTDLTKKGPTIEEILGFIDAMRARMVPVKTAIAAIDVCGTGGDRSGTFNISTAAAIVLAAGGVPVAKHGNRSASSKYGSADVLETLGIPVDNGPEAAAESLQNHNFVFLFAQKYHPALKRLAIVRKKLGFPTVFNLLGPLLNPVMMKRQVIGTFNKQNAELIAEVATHLGYEHVIVLYSQDGLDEVSLSAQTQLIETRGSQTTFSKISPQDFGLQSARLKELKEGDNPRQNAQIITDVFRSNKKLTARQRVVVLNAALGFYIHGATEGMAEGIQKATETIQNGSAAQKLKELRS